MSKIWPFHQILAIDGTTVGGDIWSCSLKTIWGPAPGLQLAFNDQETLLKSDANPPFLGLANIVQSWFTNNTEGGSQFIKAHSLVGVKFNSIGHDGKYVYPNTSEKVFSPAVPGTLNNGGDPRQSIVLTLRSDTDRGRGSFGRMFPPNQNPTYAAGASTIGAAQQTACIDLGLSLIRAINALTISGETLTVCNISPGDSVAGTSAVVLPVTRVQVDQIVDTQRRRTNRIPGNRATANV